jgi:hypothetical protein
VLHGGQEQEALSGLRVLEIAHPKAGWALLANRRSTRSGADGCAGSRIVARSAAATVRAPQAGAAHQPRDPFLAHR